MKKILALVLVLALAAIPTMAEIPSREVKSPSASVNTEAGDPVEFTELIITNKPEDIAPEAANTVAETVKAVETLTNPDAAVVAVFEKAYEKQISAVAAEAGVEAAEVKTALYAVTNLFPAASKLAEKFVKADTSAEDAKACAEVVKSFQDEENITAWVENNETFAKEGATISLYVLVDGNWELLDIVAVKLQGVTANNGIVALSIDLSTYQLDPSTPVMAGVFDPNTNTWGMGGMNASAFKTLA